MGFNLEVDILIFINDAIIVSKIFMIFLLHFLKDFLFLYRIYRNII